MCTERDVKLMTHAADMIRDAAPPLTMAAVPVGSLILSQLSDANDARRPTAIPAAAAPEACERRGLEA
jgi:hypothetical protein